MKINFVSCDWANTVFDDNGMPVIGGSGHARVILPSRYLRRHGHTTMEGQLVIQQTNRGQRLFGLVDHNGHAHPMCDVLVMERYMDQGVLAVMDEYRAMGGRVVNDVDDHFWKLDPRNNAARATDPRFNPTNNRDIYREILRKSDLITVSTAYLYREMKSMCPKVEVVVLENAVDVERYPTKTSDDAGDRPTFGWVGANAWRSGDLEATSFLGDIFRSRNLPFHHSGVMECDEETAEIFKLMEEQGVEALPPDLRHLEHKKNWFKSAGQIWGIPWATESPMTKISQYPTMFEPIDVGLVILNPVSFNLAKSFLKGLEYSAAGVPFIASRFGEYIRGNEQFGLGMLPDGTHKSFLKEKRFWDAKIELMTNPQVRQEEREKNLAIVKEKYDFATRWKDWEAVYAAVARGEKVG